MKPSPYFFGYGSLVNTATHDYLDPQPARLSGWQRSWCHTALRDVAFLTVVPAPQAQIDGLIAAVPGADWHALDQREFAYARLPANQSIRHPLASQPEMQPETQPGMQPEISFYAVPQETQNQGSPRHPILLSYLDVVVQGYLQVFGEAGVSDFFATTTGWEAPVLNDRSAPRYPRHQALAPAESKLVDHHLARLGARLI
ncbi:gamma-glutamylcyclotransferase family protein [Pseudophaeobacter leonis]|uniref:gamma-glutamylcyclotransferase family protein n=1 Tax=Pseudophaeobacter leonis TaxID=1144477 RepID=UPI0009F1EDA3|nr:gamma-glutamylcyclotransferase family protein [Pseudophaeobacter leonis]